MKEQCNECKQTTYLENRTRMLCQPCNFKRRHNGKSIQQHQLEQQQRYQQKYTDKNKDKPIKIKEKKKSNITVQQKREKEIKNRLSMLKQYIRDKAKNEDMYYCWGCGVGDEQLDCSHILSVKQRKDLEVVEENINLFCRECHIKWESGEIEKMRSLNTFQKDLDFIKENDNRIFQKILQKKIKIIFFIQS